MGGACRREDVEGELWGNEILSEDAELSDTPDVEEEEVDVVRSGVM